MIPKLKKGFGALSALPTIAIIFAIAVITMSITATIVSDVRDTQTANTLAYNISTKGLEGQTKQANWLPTIGLILGAVIIISILGMLYMKGK
jgi:glycerol uptake facilitator-like aquaporin